MANQYVPHSEFSRFPHTKRAALAVGEQFYYTGKACRRGHLSLRYASSGNCRECIALVRKKGMMNFRGKSSVRSSEDQRRAEHAAANGYTEYVPISKCPKGHALRFVTNNNCVECNRESNKKRRHSAKWSRVKKLYGLDQADILKMLSEQHGKCGICGIGIEKKYHIDHCHNTKRVRGLLCSRCNQGIGLLRESKRIMLLAIEYLEKK